MFPTDTPVPPFGMRRARARQRGKDDDLCIVHRAIVPAWPSGTDTKYDAWLVDRLHPKARCSWCLDVKRHSLESVSLFLWVL